MKRGLFFVFLLFLIFAFPVTASANLLVVKENGQVVWNVLSKEDAIALEIPKSERIEVKEAAGDISEDAVITLKRDGEKVGLTVDAEGGTKEFDVSNWSDAVVEVEERPQMQKISVGISGNKFSVQQKGIKALTSYPVIIDPKTAEFSVRTQTGNKYVSILPYQAVQTTLRSRLLSSITNNEIEIIEEDQELKYLINGEKSLSFFNLVEYSVPVKTRLSASTGEVLEIEAPIWYRVISVFMT